MTASNGPSNGAPNVPSNGTGRTLHAVLHLLDRQVLDPDGHMVGNVDDVEVDLDRDPPVVTALLQGPQAWGGRLPGPLGRFVTSAHRRLRGSDEPDRIPADAITEVTSAVHIVSTPGLQGFDDWVEEQIIRRIPGAGHAPE